MVKADDKYERASALAVARGIHVFRYIEFKGLGDPAVACVVAPAEGVTLLDMPDREDGLLVRPGDCVILRAERASEVVVRLRRGSPEGSLDASFRLEAIALAEEVAPPRVAPMIANPLRTEGAPAPISFLAHLANQGDSSFAQNVWAGGPDAPAVFEGLEIVAESGDSPIELQVLVGGRPPRWSEWVGARQYAGTRGHGLPLLGLRLRVASEASGTEIVSEALFLGALVVSKRGRQIEFLSGSGVDPLVGLKVSLQTAPRLVEERPASSLEAIAREREPRVRVFRASTGR